MPAHIWQTFAMRAMRAAIDGDLDEAERFAEQSRRLGERAEQPLAQQYYGIQLIQIRSLQGRAGELLPRVRELAERFPGIPAWRTALISLAARAGEDELGRVELERFAGDDFSAIPRDANWLPGDRPAGRGDGAAGRREAQRAALRGAAALRRPRDRRRARRGLERPRRPHPRPAGGTSGDLEEAIEHLERAVEIATGMGDRPAIAISRVDLAEALLASDGSGDRERALELLSEAIGPAREMGARWIVDRALALRLEAQGLAGVDVTTSIDDVVAELESERPDLRAHAAPDGTVAILFSDIEDSTILTERLGDERWLEVLRDHNDVFRELIADYEGFEVKSQGDGFMLAFPEPCRALECAIAIQRAFAERERGRLGRRPCGSAWACTPAR